MPPGGKAALAFSTSRYMNESELRTYFESKILGMQGVSIYYAGIPTSLSVEIVLNFDIMTPIGYDYTYTFTTADGDSRTITVKGKEQISITTPSPLSLDDPYQIFTISLSKSYPNETYQLQRDGQTVASLPGDPYGAPISFRGGIWLGNLYGYQFQLCDDSRKRSRHFSARRELYSEQNVSRQNRRQFYRGCRVLQRIGGSGAGNKYCCDS